MSLTPKARDLVARLNRDAAALRERQILAPVLPGGRVRTRLDGLVYEFRVREQFAGWGIFQPVSERDVILVAPALPWQRAAYLERLPALRVILLWPDPSRQQIGLWLSLPYNAADATQRFGLSEVEPLAVVLADPENGADRFERVVVRVDGTTLYYDNPDPRADPTHADWLREAASQPDVPERLLLGLAESERQALLYARIRALDLGDVEARSRAAVVGIRDDRERLAVLDRLSGRRGLEDRLRLALYRADAVLHSYVEVPNLDGSPDRLIVEWSVAGKTRRYRTSVGPAGDVIASGICLAGRDRDFDLTSLVSVIAEAPL
jgi:hypothetical protein